MQASPLIVSIDGNVFTGKSTLVKKLELPALNEHIPVIPYSTERDPWQEHKRYLSAEEQRINCVAEKIVVLDRSVLSLAAHTYAMWSTGIADFRKQFQEWVSGKESNILWPEVSIILTEDYTICLKRYRADKMMQTQKCTADIFLDKRYFDAIDTFYAKIALHAPITSIDGCSVDERKDLAMRLIESAVRNEREVICNGLRSVLNE